ncbi:hypothetical protein [Azospirillum argentinense]|uniref:hypothetical protein n=1 Tax=Azospirillum argentinense TaxID=2970906 RepID=UPI0010BFD0FB|nr:hypothetical protein [Azospirillum argentinense]
MSFSKILERCERLFIYLSLTLILLLESAFKIGIAVPTVTIEQKTALLLINFLLLFKIIDKKLILPQKSGVGSFADGIDHTFNKNVGKAIIYANDSAKYYQFISTKNCHIKDLTLFVFDKTSINKWMLLKSKGKIKQINVIELIDPHPFITLQSTLLEECLGFSAGMEKIYIL